MVLFSCVPQMLRALSYPGGGVIRLIPFRFDYAVNLNVTQFSNPSFRP